MTEALDTNTFLHSDIINYAIVILVQYNIHLIGLLAVDGIFGIRPLSMEKPSEVFNSLVPILACGTSFGKRQRK